MNLKTNSAGFHDVEHSLEKSINTFRVVVLGDSFVEALHVPIAEGFCQQLQLCLENKLQDKQVEVINLGLSGRGPAQHYRILEKKGLRYHPDLVIMAILPGNDFEDSSFDFNTYPYKPLYRIDKNDEIELLPYSIPPAWHPRSLLQHSSMAYFLVYEILQRPFWKNLFTTKLGLIPFKADAEKHQKSAIEPSFPLNLGLYIEPPLPIWQEAYRITLRMILATSDLSRGHGAQFIAFAIPNKRMVENPSSEMTDYKGITINFRRPFNVLNHYCEIHRIPLLI